MLELATLKANEPVILQVTNIFKSLVNYNINHIIFFVVGPSADGRLKPDVTTIGSSIVVAEDKGGLRYGSGTSYAVPLIAALGALLQQAKPKWSAQMIHEAIMVIQRCFVFFSDFVIRFLFYVVLLIIFEFN